jgi:hypothetical protein
MKIVIFITQFNIGKYLRGEFTFKTVLHDFRENIISVDVIGKE